jgi:hypothetical protein
MNPMQELKSQEQKKGLNLNYLLSRCRKWKSLVTFELFLCCLSILNYMLVMLKKSWAINVSFLQDLMDFAGGAFTFLTLSNMVNINCDTNSLWNNLCSCKMNG